MSKTRGRALQQSEQWLAEIVYSVSSMDGKHLCCEMLGWCRRCESVTHLHVIGPFHRTPRFIAICCAVIEFHGLAQYNTFNLILGQRVLLSTVQIQLDRQLVACRSIFVSDAVLMHAFSVFLGNDEWEIRFLVCHTNENLGVLDRVHIFH